MYFVPVLAFSLDLGLFNSNIILAKCDCGRSAAITPFLLRFSMFKTSKYILKRKECQYTIEFYFYVKKKGSPQELVIFSLQIPFLN